MITISLDESGQFESVREDNQEGNEGSPTFIAGVLFDDQGDKTETGRERERIEAYYRNVITSVSDGSKEFVFPSALHSNGNKMRDTSVVKLVKRKINATIHEFLVSGTFEGKPLVYKIERTGKYYIYVLLKSDQGQKKLLGENVSYMLRDNYASNLYFHMAAQVVSRLIFHNPLIRNVHDISMNIATRSSATMNINSEAAQQYLRQGYRFESIKEDGKSVFFSTSNADIYRSVLSQEMIRSGKIGLNIEEFNVKSINYRKNKNMEFLYMADSICSYLGNNIKGDSSEIWLEKIVNKANQINDKERNLIFAYDEIDGLFNRSLELFENGQVYEALSIIFEAGSVNGKFADYYNKKWFKCIKDNISENCTEMMLSEAVNKLNATITTNTLDQDKSIFIFNTIEKIYLRMKSKNICDNSKAIMYRLYDTGASLYCHIGDSDKVNKYVKKCKEYAYYVGVEEYLRTLNRIVGTLLDGFEWSKAKRIARESVEYQKTLIEIKNQLPLFQEPGYDKSMGLSKAISQEAQVYAFFRDERCEELFRKALLSYDPKSADYKITQSYLLHYYLDSNRVESYEMEATDYFGGENSPKKRLDYILEEGLKEEPIINYKYALYVFVRGLYLYEQEKISDSFSEKILNIDETIKKAAKRLKKKNSDFVVLTGHPTELILKYLALIAYDRGDVQKANTIIEDIRNRIKYTGPTVDLIINYGEVEYYDHIHDLRKRNKCISNCKKIIQSQFKMKDRFFTDNYEKNYSELANLMVYMYH